MAVRGLQAVRDAVIFAYGENIIDDEEFALLYDCNRSRRLFPHWKFNEFDLDSWDDVECQTEMRFNKNDLPLLMGLLHIPNEIVCQQGTRCRGREGMCILLRRLAYPCRYTDISHRFGRSSSELCLIFNKALDIIFEENHYRLESWVQPFISPGHLHNYAVAVHQHGAPLENCFGFVDGTVRPISRPNRNQRVVYNGHMRVHAVTF